MNNSISITEISVIVPVYKNEDTIIELTRLLKIYLKKISINFEIVFVNDASPDNSLDVLKQLVKDNSSVHYLKNDKNLGQHQSILRGIAYSRGEKIVVMDADLQDDPAMILDLFNASKKGYDAVFVKRKGQYQEGGRMLTSRIFKSITCFFTGLSKEAGTFFMIKKNLGKSILQYDCPHPYSTIMVASQAQRIGYVEGVRQQRVVGESAYSFGKRLRYAYYALECIFFLKFRKT